MSILLWYLFAFALAVSGPFVSRRLQPKPLLIWAVMLALIYLGLCNLPDYSVTNGSGDAMAWLAYFVLIGLGVLVNAVMIIRQVVKLSSEGYR